MTRFRDLVEKEDGGLGLTGQQAEGLVYGFISNNAELLETNFFDLTDLDLSKRDESMIKAAFSRIGERMGRMSKQLGVDSIKWKYHK